MTYTRLGRLVEERRADLGRPGRVVGIVGGNGVDTVVTYLAALTGGHVAMLLAGGPAPAAPPPAIAPDVLADCRGTGCRIADRGGSAYAPHPELALLSSTSGSTGSPRIVRISHEGLDANARAIGGYLGLGPEDRAVTSLPLHYCYGLSVLNSHLAAGAALVLTDASVTDPAFWAAFADGRATSLAGVPRTFELLDRAGFADMDLPSLRRVTQAGGRLAPDLVRRFARLGARRGWELFVMYGQTEATARMAYLPPHLAEARPEAIGVPIPGGEIRIDPVPGEAGRGTGEIVFRGPNVMLGYATAPEDLSRGRDVHELRTGDLGRIADDGLLEVTGRLSRFLKIAGLRIDLGQLERNLEARGIRAVCAGSDELLVVAVTGTPRAACVPAAIAADLGIPAGAVRVLVPAEIPTLPNGKPDLRMIAALGAAAAPAPAPAEPAGSPDDRLDRLTAAFRDALGTSRVGPDDTFAGLGGDSLSYVEASIAVEDVLGDLPEGWPEMTIRELAASGGEPDAARGRGARMETNVVLRAGAILLVVAHHMAMSSIWPPGGAHLLLALAGHSFARFQLTATAGPRTWLRSISRIALPTSAWIALQVAVAGGYSLGAIALVNNYTGDRSHRDGRWLFWFIEALVQILAVLAVLFAVPALRRLERRHPFALVAALLVPALLVRFDVAGIRGDVNVMYRPHAIAWLFLIGWAAQRATGPGQRLLLSAAVLVSVPGFFDVHEREAVIVAGLLALIWVRTVPVPRRLTPLVGAVAAASLWIYLTHWEVWPVAMWLLPTELAFPLVVAAGVAAAVAGRRLAPLPGAVRRRAAAARPRTPTTTGDRMTDTPSRTALAASEASR